MMRNGNSRGYRGELRPDRHSAERSTNVLPLQIPAIEVGRFVLAKHDRAADYKDHPLGRYIDSVIEMNELRAHQAEQINEILVHPKELFVRYVSNAKIKERYEDYVRRHGIHNMTARHHRGHLREIKRDFAEALAGQSALDAQIQKDRVAEAVRVKVNDENQHLLDKLGARYGEEFEVTAGTVIDPGAYFQDGTAELTLSRRLAFEDGSLMLRLAKTDLDNLTIVEHDLARINHALKQTDLLGSYGKLTYDDLSLELPISRVGAFGLDPNLDVPITPSDPIMFQPLGIHEIN